MVILSAKERQDPRQTSRSPHGSDGSIFQPGHDGSLQHAVGNGTLTIVKENSPTSFEIEQNLQTMNGARTIAFDPKTNHIFTMSDERPPAPPPPTPGGRWSWRSLPAIPGSFTILMIGK